MIIRDCRRAAVVATSASRARGTSWWNHRLRAGAGAIGVIAFASVLIQLFSNKPAPAATAPPLGAELQPSISQRATTSSVAYRLYDRGLKAYYEMDRTAAYRLFHAALAEDSTFAMAAYYAGFARKTFRSAKRCFDAPPDCPFAPPIASD